jgi:Raf kinase inhibitor-like YbhB/YbcL family protein
MKALLASTLFFALFVGGCSSDPESSGTNGTGGATPSGSGGSTASGDGGGQGVGGGGTGAGGNAGTGGGGQGGQGPFVLTSTAYDEGGMIPKVHSCESPLNTSPALAWTGAPAGTQSFALVFKDLTFNNFLHSAIWDIPASRNDLPENVDKTFQPADVPGAKQPESYAGNRGYAGPCPPNAHTYEFALYALDEPTLAGLDMSSSIDDVLTAAEASPLGVATLSGIYTPGQ